MKTEWEASSPIATNRFSPELLSALRRVTVSALMASFSAKSSPKLTRIGMALAFGSWRDTFIPKVTETKWPEKKANKWKANKWWNEPWGPVSQTTTVSRTGGGAAGGGLSPRISFKPTCCGSHDALPRTPAGSRTTARLRSVVLPDISAACSPRRLNTSIADRWTVTTQRPPPLHFHLPYIHCYQVLRSPPPFLPPPPLSPWYHHPSSPLRPFNPVLQTALCGWTMESLLPQGGVLWGGFSQGAAEVTLTV